MTMLPTIKDLIIENRKKREGQREKQKKRTNTFRKKLSELSVKDEKTNDTK